MFTITNAAVDAIVSKGSSHPVPLTRYNYAKQRQVPQFRYGAAISFLPRTFSFAKGANGHALQYGWLRDKPTNIHQGIGETFAI